MAYNKLNTFKLIENQSHGLKAFKCKFKSLYTLKHCGSMHSTTFVLSTYLIDCKILNMLCVSNFLSRICNLFNAF